MKRYVHCFIVSICSYLNLCEKQLIYCLLYQVLYSKCPVETEYDDNLLNE